jgi:hypothetical protein
MFLYFDPSTWDGSDVFVSDKTGFTFVNASVKGALEAASISNLRFWRVPEF